MPEVKLYEHADFGGRFKSFYTNTPYVGHNLLNNSAFQVFIVI